MFVAVVALFGIGRAVRDDDEVLAQVLRAMLKHGGVVREDKRFKNFKKTAGVFH